MHNNTKEMVAMYREVYDTLQQHAQDIGEVEGFAGLVDNFNAAMAELATAIQELKTIIAMDKQSDDIVIFLDEFDKTWDQREKAGTQANPTIAKINDLVGKIDGIVGQMDAVVEKFAKVNPRFLAAYKAARVVKNKDGTGGDAHTGK